MSRHPGYFVRDGSERLDELKKKRADLERELGDTRDLLEQELSSWAHVPEPPNGHEYETYLWPLADEASMAALDPWAAAPWPNEATLPPVDPAPDAEPPWPGACLDEPEEGEQARSPDDRTADLVHHGRHTAERKRRHRGILRGCAATALLAVVVTVVALLTSGPVASWPASVATVQREISVACQNPDVASEPSQVNFACAQATRRILWVFALMTSRNNPAFSSVRTGRQGLEPITPAQGGEVAWSLNLHHPYNPANPIDSLEVAARAINNIIGGATLTAANGKPVVQPGLESVAANCARYTGSPAVTSRNGYPDLCAKPITTTVGRAALVADVYQKWVLGAPAGAAKDAAVLFQNARNPGNPRVRTILRSLQSARPAA